MCVRVCVCERETDREREQVYVCVCVLFFCLWPVAPSLFHLRENERGGTFTEFVFSFKIQQEFGPIVVVNHYI